MRRLLALSAAGSCAHPPGDGASSCAARGCQICPSGERRGNGNVRHEAIRLAARRDARSSVRVLYATLSPDVTRQGWDSLSYAYAAETSSVPALWPNHPLGHAVLELSLGIVRRIGYANRALPLFVVVGSMFGGLAITCLFLTCNVLVEADRWASLSLALLLGGSYSVWRLAGSADIYSFSLLLCAAAWAGIIYHVRFQTRPGLAGALVGLATLGHQLNGFLMVPGVF